MTKSDLDALIEEAKKLGGEELVVKRNYDKDSEQTYVFKSISGSMGCGIKGEGMNWIAYGSLQAKDGKGEQIFPLQTVVKAIQEKLPIIIITGNQIIKEKQN
jgi:hypothetical protein